MLRGLPVVAVVLLAACGGGGEGTPVPTADTETSTGILTVTVPNTVNPKPVPTGKPSFTITLTAESHTARAGRPWGFTVRAVDAEGKPAAATAKMRVFVGEEEVDTIGFFKFTGTFRRTYRFSPLLKGKDAILQAEVEGDGGTVRANWPVHVT